MYVNIVLTFSNILYTSNSLLGSKTNRRKKKKKPSGNTSRNTES